MTPDKSNNSPLSFVSVGFAVAGWAVLWLCHFPFRGSQGSFETLLLYFFGSFLLSLVGLITGIVSISLKNSGKVLCIISIILSGIFILFFFFIVAVITAGGIS
ncbi:MAG: hypothetical protein GY749_07190 [Desulfobacteraceae bacterium]|nr:hypothetical protein [Desulfobacteraceae bacterium]